ncbi:MAG: L-2-amino-thiazoline-4-carboxylic acid hydrolase [Synergistaceae bacterium]|jgi:hypothetical protein|nr:L-2-amino-thiazoline-4-carboxylic acid hydrolase [Synergistaceae bacterium]
MERFEAAKNFYIEDHAVLMALFTKSAMEKYAGRGEKAILRAIAVYGRERGLRAAMRCVSDNESLSMENYILYGEWYDPKGASKSEIAALAPDYRTNMTVCGWCETWIEHGLLEYGRVYCENVDENLVYGFNPELKLVMGKMLSHGEGVCEFCWTGCRLEDASEFSRKRHEKIPRVTRDFLYHCGHLTSTFRREILVELGLLKGDEIISSALEEYEKIFGAEKRSYIANESLQNFLTI